MPEYINFAISGIVRLIVAGAALIIARYAIPWLKEHQLYALVQKLVRAAEKQKEAGTLVIGKKEYVIAMLKAAGVEVTPYVDALIEAAVEELDIALESGIFTAYFDDEEFEEPDDAAAEESAEA